MIPPQALLQGVQNYGKRWAHLARAIDGRNQTKIRDRWRSLSRKYDKLTESGITRQNGDGVINALFMYKNLETSLAAGKTASGKLAENLEAVQWLVILEQQRSRQAQHSTKHMQMNQLTTKQHKPQLLMPSSASRICPPMPEDVGVPLPTGMGKLLQRPSGVGGGVDGAAAAAAVTAAAAGGAHSYDVHRHFQIQQAQAFSPSESPLSSSYPQFPWDPDKFLLLRMCLSQQKQPGSASGDSLHSHSSSSASVSVSASASPRASVAVAASVLSQALSSKRSKVEPPPECPASKWHIPASNATPTRMPPGHMAMVLAMQQQQQLIAQLQSQQEEQIQQHRSLAQRQHQLLLLHARQGMMRPLQKRPEQMEMPMHGQSQSICPVKHQQNPLPAQTSAKGTSAEAPAIEGALALLAAASHTIES